MDQWQRDSHLSTLSDSGHVNLFTRRTTGRSSVVLVAEDYTSSYVEKHPHDSPAIEGIKTILRRR
jgi:hypothetical protein